MRKPRPSYKDIINWKAFNYLVDKTTKYSDSGLHIHVCAKLKTSEYNTYVNIYAKNILAGDDDIVTKLEAISFPMKTKEYKFYTDYGVYYSIWAQYVGGGWPKGFANEFYEIIKDKFDKICVELMGDLIVKVKE